MKRALTEQLSDWETDLARKPILLRGIVNPKFFKIILSDIGLMQAVLDYDCKPWILEPEKAAADFGSVVEAFIGQEILAYSPPDQKKELYYWAREKRGSSAEVDYVVEIKGKIVPVEVKAGKSSALKSMFLFLREKPSSQYGYHFSQLNFSTGLNILKFPLYAVHKALSASSLIWGSTIN